MPAVPPAPAPATLGQTPSQPALPDTQTRATRALALVLWAALVLLCVGWELWWAPTGRGTLVVKVLPLLPALPGLWRLRLYTYRWLSLVVWLYVAEGLVRAPGDTGLGAGLAWAEVVLGMALFAVCAAHVRWRLKHATPVAAVAP